MQANYLFKLVCKYDVRILLLRSNVVELCQPKIVTVFFNPFTSRPKCMPGSMDPGVTIVNPTRIFVMYGYVT